MNRPISLSMLASRRHKVWHLTVNAPNCSSYRSLPFIAVDPAHHSLAVHHDLHLNLLHRIVPKPWYPVVLVPCLVLLFLSKCFASCLDISRSSTTISRFRIQFLYQILSFFHPLSHSRIPHHAPVLKASRAFPIGHSMSQSFLFLHQDVVLHRKMDRDSFMTGTSPS